MSGINARPATYHRHHWQHLRRHLLLHGQGGSLQRLQKSRPSGAMRSKAEAMSALNTRHYGDVNELERTQEAINFLRLS